QIAAEQFMRQITSAIKKHIRSEWKRGYEDGKRESASSPASSQIADKAREIAIEISHTLALNGRLMTESNVDTIAAILSHHLAGGAPAWTSVNGVAVRWDDDAKVFVGRYIVYSQGTSQEEAVAAVKSALIILGQVIAQREAAPPPESAEGKEGK